MREGRYGLIDHEPLGSIEAKEAMGIIVYQHSGHSSLERIQLGIHDVTISNTSIPYRIASIYITTL